MQIFRFTSSKPSKSAIASDEKFIRLRTNSFVRYCLNEIRANWFKRTVQTITYMPYFLSWVVTDALIKSLFHLQEE